MSYRRSILMLLACVVAAHGTHAAANKGGSSSATASTTTGKVGGWGSLSKTSVQLDPLRVVKTFTETYKKGQQEDGPTIVVAMDMSPRMNYDAEGAWYDLMPWPSNKAPAGIAIAASSKTYRRKYSKLTRSATTGSYTADAISAVDQTSSSYASFYGQTRLGLARTALTRVIKENQYVARFGLVRSRYGANVALPNHEGNESPVVLLSGQSNLAGDLGNKSWAVTYVRPTSRNVDASAADTEVIVKADSKTPNTDIITLVGRDPDTSDALLPAGLDDDSFEDAPIAKLLDDTRAEIVRIMTADLDELRPCRNTAVVLVTGGTEGGEADPVVAARKFKSVSAKGVTKPVPIYVIAIEPRAADVAELKEIATETGGMYFEAEGVADITYGANIAVQSVFRHEDDFDNGTLTEIQTGSPIVGTVDLTNAADINGNTLSNTSLTTPTGSPLTQRENVVLTAGYALPGFEGRLRAFRTYVGQADANEPSGYTFVKDGTALWVAHTPDPAQRNIYTYIPGSGPVAFTSANAAVLRPYLKQTTDEEATTLIEFIRQQSLGAFIDSTPAIMDPPSQSPPPDSDYTTFAGQREGRRSTIFIGGNNGMLHAIDGRLGVETYAFIPFNLLPKLMTLSDGQSVGSFDYFVDSSPKIADVKVNGAWRTFLTIGQGPGGTFYQTFDVSDFGMNVSPTADSEDAVVQAYASPTTLAFKWSFPSYNSFDHTMSTTEMPFGDLKSTASNLEKSVGQTWSDPAIGQVDDEAGAWVLATGSGYLSEATEQQANRNGLRAGSTLYIIDVGTGTVLIAKDVGDDDGRKTLKNSLQADATLVGPPDTRFVNKAYIGDTEGRIWRLNFTKSGTSVSLQSMTELYDTLKEHPIFTSIAVSSVGTNNYLFFMSGSDLMPATFMLKAFKLVGLVDTGTTVSLQFEKALAQTDGKQGDEHPTSAPVVSGDAVFFTTTTEWPDEPCKGTQTTLYGMTFGGGAAYDTNGDGKIDSSKSGGDSTVLKTMSGRASAPFVADQHLYFGAGDKLEVFGDAQDFNNGLGELSIRLLSWRAVK